MLTKKYFIYMMSVYRKLAFIVRLYTSAVKTRRSNPEKMFLKISYYSSSIHKSKVHFNNCFLYDAPKLWNDLSLEIQTAATLSCFKR